MFETEEGEPREVAVKYVGDLENLLDESGQENGFEHAQELVQIFKEAQTTVTTPKGKEIQKRPHLLIVGGFVRDPMIGQKSKDIDLPLT